MVGKLRQAGYIADTSWVLKPLSDAEKLRDICHHSEKLALAYAFMSLPADEDVVIAKNMRMCGDCHTATALLSRVYNRRITVRDNSRFHVFIDGKCSCNNYY
jgi:DYW family of nucleic acid deaminases